MIKYLLGAILALAIVGGAFTFKSDDYSWQLVVHKKEALNSVTSGALRIYKIVSNLFSSSNFSETSKIVVEDA